MIIIGNIEHFLDTGSEFISLDVSGIIYMIKPSSVKIGMIDVKKCWNKNSFVELLKSNPEINYEELKQCTLYYPTRCRKWKNLRKYSIIGKFDSYTNIDLSDKEIFIYLTKMHSAKDLILKELKEQLEEGKLFP